MNTPKQNITIQILEVDDGFTVRGTSGAKSRTFVAKDFDEAQKKTTSYLDSLKETPDAAIPT